MSKNPMFRTAPVRLQTVLTVVVACAMSGGCGPLPSTALQRLVEARQRAADLLVQFTQAADATNRAVMSDTDDTSAKAAQEAMQATAVVQKDVEALRPVLQELRYSEEVDLLDEFAGRFAEYGKLDRSILDLAVENTNLKAQRLSFGPAREAADAVEEALRGVAASAPGEGALRVEALTATAVKEVREIQALQAPHIAEADDAAMTVLETRISASEAAARKALLALGPVVSVATRPRLTAATAALDRFTALNAEIVGLSRRNTNVRSLALSLGQKRMITAACEDSLRALQDSLAKRGFSGSR